MYREIKKKKLILDNRKPYLREVREFLDELEGVDMAYTSLRLDGSPLTRDEVRRIYGGEFIVSEGLNDHARVERYKNLLTKMREIANRRYDISEELIYTLYVELTGAEPERRTNNPVIYEWSYNPPHPSEADKLMVSFFGWANREQPDMTNYVYKASEIHNKFLEIYPLAEKNEEMARILFYYYIIKKGYCVFELDFSEREYNTAIAEYISDGDITHFYSVAERSLFKKLEIMMQVTARD